MPQQHRGRVKCNMVLQSLYQNWDENERKHPSNLSWDVLSDRRDPWLLGVLAYCPVGSWPRCNYSARGGEVCFVRIEFKICGIVRTGFRPTSECETFICVFHCMLPVRAGCIWRYIFPCGSPIRPMFIVIGIHMIFGENIMGAMCSRRGALVTYAAALET